MAAWAWTPERRECLRLFLVGASRREIARRTGRHRNTINAWCRNAAFVREARRVLDELVTSTRLRRLREMTSYGDRVSRLARGALASAETDPQNDAVSRRALSWLSEFRAHYRHEAKELVTEAGWIADQRHASEPAVEKRALDWLQRLRESDCLDDA